MSGTPLADLFVARGGPADADATTLQARLERLLEDAAEPELSAPIVIEVARRVADGDPWPTDTASIRELGLACACAAGRASALRELDEHYMGIVATATAHMRLDAATVDEVRQQVRQKLLVPDAEGAVKLVRYAGRGKLRGLVKVVAVRTALDRLRRNKADPAGGKSTGDEDFERLASPAEDPELHFLKAHYREAFRTAFARAVGQLDRRDRNILRLHQLGGMTLEDLARMYGQYRSTIVRTLARVRKQLFSATREALREDLKLSRDEFDSVMVLIRSRLEVGLSRLLQTVTPAHDEDEPSPSS